MIFQEDLSGCKLFAELKEGAEKLLESHLMGPAGPGGLRAICCRQQRAAKGCGAIAGPLPRLPASWFPVEKGNSKEQGKSEMRSLPLRRRAGKNTVLMGPEDLDPGNGEEPGEKSEVLHSWVATQDPLRI